MNGVTNSGSDWPAGEERRSNTSWKVSLASVAGPLDEERSGPS